MPPPRRPRPGRRPATALVGVLVAVAGGYLALRPLASLAVLLLTVVGGLLLAAVGELLDRPEVGGSRWRYVRALAYLLGAIGVAVLTGWGVAAVVLAAGVSLVVAGVSDLLEARRARGPERWSSLPGGVSSMTFGGLALAWPDVSVLVIDSSAATYDDVRFDDYVRPGARPIVRAMAGRCLGEPSVLLSLGTVLALDRTIWDGDPDSGALAVRLRQNVPTLPVTAPLLLGQGEDDRLVTRAGQEEFVDSLCAAGGQVDYRTYAGRGHLDLVAAGSPAVTDLLDWTRERLEGGPASSTCEAGG